MRAASNKARVLSSSGTCRLMTSDCATSSSRPSRRAPTSAKAGCAASSIGSKATTCMPRARASRPVSWPIEPKPTRPSVLPPASRPLESAVARPLTGRHRRCAGVCAAQQQQRRADHVLGNRQRIGAAGGYHLQATPLASRHVDVVQADAEPADHARPGQRIEQRATHLGAVAHDQGIGRGRLRQQPGRVIDQRRLVQHVVCGASAAARRARR